MDLQQLRRTWDNLGEADPLWAVLAAPSKRGNRWDVREFGATLDEAGGESGQGTG